jgi:hypothetical protein
MGMAANQFLADADCYGIEIESLVFFGDAGVKHHLQQQVTELLLQVLVIAMTDGIGHLMGFLQYIRGERLVRLFQVPRATPCGIA